MGIEDTQLFFRKFGDLFIPKRLATGPSGGVWYYAPGLDADSFTHIYEYDPGETWGDTVELGGLTGTITKIGVKINAATNVEVRLYDAANSVLIGCYQFATTADVWSDSGTISVLVDAQDIFVMGAIQITANAYYAATTGGLYKNATWQYGGACEGNFTGANDYQHAVRLYFVES